MPNITSLTINQNKIEIPEGVKTIYNHISYEMRDGKVYILRGSKCVMPNGVSNGKKVFTEYEFSSDTSYRNANNVFLAGLGYRLILNDNKFIFSTTQPTAKINDFWYNPSTNTLLRYSKDYGGGDGVNPIFDTNYGGLFSFPFIQITCNSSSVITNVEVIDKLNIDFKTITNLNSFS